MIGMARKTIKGLLKKQGYTIKLYNYHDEQIERVRYNWITRLDIQTVIDVGGGLGEFATKARQILPDAKIITYEAIPDSYQRICERFAGDDRHQAYNFALSDKVGEVEFFISSNNGSSSLLEMGRLHKEAYPYSSDITSLIVKTSRLDDTLSTGFLSKNLWLKLDVQGAELKVLEGAKKLLGETSLVFMETSFSELYHGQPLFNEVAEYMKSHGFRVVGIENISQDIRDGTFLQCDIFFARI